MFSAPSTPTYVSATLDSAAAVDFGAPALAGLACTDGVCQAALGTDCAATFCSLYVDIAPAVFRVRCRVFGQSELKMRCSYTGRRDSIGQIIAGAYTRSESNSDKR